VGGVAGRVGSGREIGQDRLRQGEGGLGRPKPDRPDAAGSNGYRVAPARFSWSVFQREQCHLVHAKSSRNPPKKLYGIEGGPDEESVPRILVAPSHTVKIPAMQS
jgi:hypothetical protein